MPAIADYTVVSDASFTLPGELLNDRHFPNLSFPAVSTGSPAVLMFRVDPVEIPARVVIQINNRPSCRRRSTPRRSGRGTR